MNDNPYKPPNSQIELSMIELKPMVIIFRAIVVVSTILFVFHWLSPYIDYLWLSDEELKLLAYDGWGSKIPDHPIFFWSLFLFGFSVAIGVFLFIPIARTLFLVMTVISIILSLFWGIRVFTSLDVTIASIVGLLDGVILTMAYFTSVSKKFNKSIN